MVMLLAKSCKRWHRWRFCTTVISQVTSNLPRCSSLIPHHGTLSSVHHMYKRMPSTCSNKVDTCPPGTKQGQEYLADEVRKRKKKKLESQPMPMKCMRHIAKAIEDSQSSLCMDCHAQVDYVTRGHRMMQAHELDGPQYTDTLH